MVGRLRDLEVAAMMKRTGIWAESDPNHIAELRGSQRHEDQELKELQERTTAAETPAGPIDLNTATLEQLQSVKGVGPTLAARIVAARPFKSVDELKKVKGVGSKKLEQFRSHFVVPEEKPKADEQEQEGAPK
jgi:competence ComEA-like helix-hairpin-helix protein